MTRTGSGRGVKRLPGEVVLPPIDALVQGWALTTAVEVALAHAETFPARADGHGLQLRALLELGQRVSGADYARIEVERPG